ncbi:hypothetical protein ACFT0G_16720 [Streptomyces sp. NPDC057020]|uniref:hypothetical protein n=1 Tax=unclassified Streptomyces TaxID=2593676 RepID=UPI001E44C790|nr:hypothetical protein [Streptomyces sp. MBT42]MCD2462293.1 hypothetical protein [Streptomyces sp. MBT42]
MEHFLAGSPPEGPVANGIASRDTDSYLEVKALVSDLWLPSYVIPIEEGIHAAATCWDNQFDTMVDQLEKPSVVKAWRRMHPTWLACVENCLKERYGDGTVMQLIDPDDMNRKWLVAVVFRPRGTDAAQSAAMGAAVDRVITLSAQMAAEFHTKPSALEYIRAAGSGFFQGAAEGAALANRFREAATQWIPTTA